MKLKISFLLGVLLGFTLMNLYLTNYYQEIGYRNDNDQNENQQTFVSSIVLVGNLINSEKTSFRSDIKTFTNWQLEQYIFVGMVFLAGLIYKIIRHRKIVIDKPEELLEIAKKKFNMKKNVKKGRNK